MKGDRNPLNRADAISVMIRQSIAGSIDNFSRKDNPAGSHVQNTHKMPVSCIEPKPSIDSARSKLQL
jgi:hypothetical protein